MRNPVAIVGLFVNEAPERMLAIMRQCGLDAIQLSGNEVQARWQIQLPGIKLFKSIRLDGSPESSRLAGSTPYASDAPPTGRWRACARIIWRGGVLTGPRG